MKRALLAGAALLAMGLPLGAQITLFEQPALITSAGQSADVQIASVQARKAGLQTVLVKAAGPTDLAAAKTLILVFGASLKGLGAAGLDVEKEKGRIKALLDGAKTKGVPILALHLGGEARRGDLTDEMVAAYLPFARMAIVVKSGNKDGLFTRICRDKNIPLKEIDKTLDLVEPLKQAFK
ncbi:MAG: DUF6305 family protein [Candidatus Aminicenantes bacterium]|nr:DUF6305 family protein [Candidatus Aminicenantes bacterium]